MDRKRVGEVVESAIADYGGSSVKSIVVWHLKHRFNLDPADAIERPEEFILALREIYGAFEEAVEQRICERLASEYGVDYEGGGLIEISKKLKGM